MLVRVLAESLKRSLRGNAASFRFCVAEHKRRYPVSQVLFIKLPCTSGLSFFLIICAFADVVILVLRFAVDSACAALIERTIAITL